MGDVHHLQTSADSQARLLEQWITETIAEYPNEQIAARWAEMARETARKFPGPPSPSQSNIDLDHLSSLTKVDRDKVLCEVQTFVAGYFDDVRQQLMLVHHELLKLQKTVAELEHQNRES